MKPLSIQLYTLRDEAEKDFTATLKRVAEIGFAGVEPAGFWDLSPAEFKSIVTDLGMEVSSSHSPWVNPENISEVIDVAGILGIDKVACGYMPDAFKDMDAMRATADTVNSMIEPLKKAGLTLFQHNHFWEFNTIDGRIAYDAYIEMCPEIKFELDSYWATNYGKLDAAEQIAKFKDRTILMHVKDGTFVPDEPNVAVGSGKMDILAAIAAADEDVLQWLIVEFDNCGTDLYEAIEQSYNYLVSNGLGKGNK